MAEAYAVGGKEAEKAEMERQRVERINKMDRDHENFQKFINENREKKMAGKVLIEEIAGGEEKQNPEGRRDSWVVVDKEEGQGSGEDGSEGMQCTIQSEAIVKETEKKVAVKKPLITVLGGEEKEEEGNGEDDEMPALESILSTTAIATSTTTTTTTTKVAWQATGNPKIQLMGDKVESTEKKGAGAVASKSLVEMLGNEEGQEAPAAMPRGEDTLTELD